MIITAKDKININEDFKVEAGPGAGKTEFLVNHIKSIIDNSERLSNSRKIACITYTNIAVETILKRVGKNASNMIEVTTIHSFLYKNVVKPYCSFIPEEYELFAKKVKGHDDLYISSKYIREWFEDGDFSGLKHPNSKNQILGFPAMTQALQSWLLSMKCTFNNETLTFECENTKAVGYDKDNKPIRLNKKNLEVLSSKIIDLKRIYWRKGKLDHNDVLYFSYVLIDQYPFILEILRAKFPYMFIDEYQDTNPIQSYILDQIRKKETVVGVIGDKAQSIYAFQGANPHLFESFNTGDSCHYTINNNYRCSNKIIKLLNDIREDIIQESTEEKNCGEVVIYVGDRIKAYKKACEECQGGTVTSLSRDNITSNAMKKEIDNHNLNKKLLDQFNMDDSNNKRRDYILSFIGAIELAQNGNIKESIKKIEWIFRNENDPKKVALFSLSKILAFYEKYCDKSLMDFYNLISNALESSLPKVTRGAPKIFYENVSYKEIAICINITEDSSNHVTIHKAKGAEFDAVFIVDSKYLKKFLIEPDLNRNEEHRVFYVALSRARDRLFIQLDELKPSEEKAIKHRYPYLIFDRV
ncbi:ATP-dependent helicase [Alkalibacterium sp. m-11]|uniref:DNA 3'-5' helicase n=1 Tax=Alkalibacterium indicireducens TaxID=398758 RepID=A0ABP3KU39_9LACT